MNQFLESAGIALQAIWSNKLRSFLTVLGNIVAVTSIIAVVTLIQGMNEYVTNAIVTDVRYGDAPPFGVVRRARYWTNLPLTSLISDPLVVNHLSADPSEPCHAACSRASFASAART